VHRNQIFSCRLSAASGVREAAHLGCFLRDAEGGELVTENAAACEEKCLLHAVPAFNETCKHWSWGNREGSQHYQKCYLIGKKAYRVSDRRFTAGTCKGGANRNEHAIKEEKKLCERIMHSADSLRVWMNVEHQISLPDEKCQDLFTYMKIRKLCTSDSMFQATLALFSPPPPREDTLYEKMCAAIAAIVDFVSSNIELIGTIVTVLSPLLIPLLSWLLGMLFRRVPILEAILQPVLPSCLRRGEQGDRAGNDINTSAEEAAQSESEPAADGE